MELQQYQWAVVLINFDPAIGSEQAGTRPAIIISQEHINKALGTVSVVPLTSKKPGRHIYPNEVLVPEGTAGLKKDSIALGHQIRSVAKARLRTCYGYIDSYQIKASIHKSLQDHLDLPSC